MFMKTQETRSIMRYQHKFLLEVARTKPDNELSSCPVVLQQLARKT